MIKKLRASQVLLSIPAGLLAGLLISQSAHAGLNKWVDEDGQVHYGDRVPPQYLKKQHSTLNEQGITVRTSEVLPTEAEEQAKADENAKKAAEQKKQLIEDRKNALHDRVLLDTFTTESDLILARDARIDAVDSQISLAETLIKNDEKKLADVKLRMNRIETSGRKVPENLHKEVTSVSRQLENNYAYIEDKNNEREEILKTFDEDVKRFRTLKEEKQKARGNTQP